MNELLNHAIMNLFIGFGLALINVIVCYFVPRIPRVISLTYWGLKPRVFILAYLIALIFQVQFSLITNQFSVLTRRLLLDTHRLQRIISPGSLNGCDKNFAEFLIFRD